MVPDVPDTTQQSSYTVPAGQNSKRHEPGAVASARLRVGTILARRISLTPPQDPRHAGPQTPAVPPPPGGADPP